MRLWKLLIVLIGATVMITGCERDLNIAIETITPLATQPMVEEFAEPIETSEGGTDSLVCQVSTFNPNPIATSNDPQIRDEPYLWESELKEETFHGLTPFNGGILENQWVSLIADNGEPYLQGTECEDLNLSWQDPRFAFMSVYAALDRTIQWLSDINREDVLPPNLQVRVSETHPISEYDPKIRELLIGSRQCEDVICACNSEVAQCPLSTDNRSIWPHAQDADVVIHEYGHAILHHLICGEVADCVLPVGEYVTVLDEGFADYLATAVNLSTSEQKNDPYCLGEWYNSFQEYPGPCLRHLDSDLHWPESARALRESLPYGYSSIWTSALLKARKELPDPAIMDQIVLEAYAGLHDETTLEEMAERLIEAAKRIDDGKHEPVVRYFLGEQGFLNKVTPPATPSGEMDTREAELDLDSWNLSSFPTFDHEREITIPGANAIQLNFDRIRLRNGDCIHAQCGRIYIGDAKGNIYEVIADVYNEYTSVIVPGDTIVLRFVASFDHTRTIIYQVNSINVWIADLDINDN